MIRTKIYALLLAFMLASFFTGCFEGDSKSSGPSVPVSYTSLKGSVAAPEKIESTLLPAILDRTDSTVRNAFAAPLVYVNGYQAASFTIDSSGTIWPLRVYNVPVAANGKYLIEIVAGKVVLKSSIKTAERESFIVSLETTAAALLAEALGKEQQEMLASYPAIVNSLKSDLIGAAAKTATELGGNMVLATLITDAVKTYKEYVDAIGDLSSSAKLAYLQKENDLDGDGIDDLMIIQVGGGQRIRFYTALATATSLFEGAGSIASYTDEKLLQDFTQGLASENNTFNAQQKNFVSGLFFKKSAVADLYLKVFVHRIDLDTEGVFKGVVAEYALITSQATAISSGSKTLYLNGNPIEGAVAATDFLTDGISTENNLTYISAQSGIGCITGNTMLVAVVDGKPELANLSSAPKFLAGVYFANTSAALNDLQAGRALAVGDVFSAYFPTSKNYALFKIKQIDANGITLDYKVNTTPNEPKF